MIKGKNLTEGNILKILISLTLPIIGTSFLQMTYGLVDMMWIGRLGSNAVASIGTASFYIRMGYAINSIIVMGGGIKIAHCIGSNNKKDLHEYINSAFTVNILISVVYFILLYLLRFPLIRYFNLTNLQIEMDAIIYLVIAGFSLIFLFENMLFMRILNSFGETKLPFKISAIGILLNIILDPIFIFVLDYKVTGAAIATLLSQFITTMLYIIVSRKYFELSSLFNIYSDKIKNIFKLGIPGGIQRIIFTGISIVIGKIVSNFGADAIAAQKIGVQIESISYLTAGGLYGSMSAFAGQNFGAKKLIRIKEGFKMAGILAVTFGLVTSILFIFFPESLMRLFINNLETIEIGKDYLIILGYTQIFMCIEIVSSASFHGIGSPNIPSSVSIIFTGARIPVAYYLSSIYGIKGVWIAISLSMLAKGLITPTAFTFKLKGLIKQNGGIYEQNKF
ncbi:MAG: MATE family efflux transporter [Fusobacterium sp.]